MSLERFYTLKNKITSEDNNSPLEIGAEVLVVNSHVYGKYTCVGKYAGRPKDIDIDTKFKSQGYDNFVIEDTFTLPVEIVLETGCRDSTEYHARIVKTIKERGLREGRTAHGLDAGTYLYRVK